LATSHVVNRRTSSDESDTSDHGRRSEPIDCQFDKILAASELAGHRTKGFFGSSSGLRNSTTGAPEKHEHDDPENPGGR
jgi:hypothetical protein